jgi:hypothetical protein
MYSLILFVFASLSVKINAHGYISYPPAKYLDDTVKTTYVDIINGPQLYSDKKWDDTPSKNLEQFNSLNIDNLKKFILSHSKNICSRNDMSSPVKFLAQPYMSWQNDQELKGFIPSHTGPCEIWLDNTKVYNSKNCVGDNTNYPASIQMSYKQCKNNCTLQFYWLALHEPNWQVYSGCAWIQPTTNC